MDQPLTKRPAAGATLAYLQCSAVTCGVLAQVLGGVSKTLGVKLHIVSTGASVSDEVTAMNSIIASKPAIVVLPGLAAQPICAQMKQLSAQGAAVATLGMDNVSQCGVKAAINGESSAELGGRLLADWVVMQKGSKANVVFYYTPELSFSPFEQHAFQAQLTKLCPSCTARFVDLPLAGYGTSAPGTVVSDLQSHPQTNVALFVSEEAASGLPAAMKTAGLTHVLTNGWGPEPANLQDIKSGGLTGGVGVDVVTMTWEAVDAAARIATGQALTAGEQQGIPPTQLLAQKDITFNPATGFLPYPNVAQRFATLWAAH
ncbi:MAG TPA: substrate-binding domain-containing protein [Solirubrobacteraceae bacterium]|nr:substrate-binding domain-containing protein [Solirubrobacteraceae bacterium]